MIGGVLMQERIEHLSDLSGNCDVAVNCSGLGSRWLCQDNSVLPIRGQVRMIWIWSAINVTILDTAGEGPLDQDCPVRRRRVHHPWTEVGDGGWHQAVQRLDDGRVSTRLCQDLVQSLPDLPQHRRGRGAGGGGGAQASQVHAQGGGGEGVQ